MLLRFVYCTLLCVRAELRHFENFLMKKPNKFNPAKKGRQKHKKTGIRMGQPARQQLLAQPIERVEAKTFAVTVAQAPVVRPQGDPLKDEGKRKLWEQKQTLLEARWLESQERKKVARIAQRRRLRISYGVTGTALTLLLCIITWNYA